jgi:hypothetical protein
MKRIALLASTENVFKLKEMFEATPLNVDFILFNKNFDSEGNYDFGHFSEQSVLIEDTMVPIFESEDKKRSPLQNQKLKLLQHEVDQLKKIIFQNQISPSDGNAEFRSNLATSKNLRFEKEDANNIYLSSQIKDLTIDPQNSLVKFEINQSQLLDYDHILLENNDRIYEFTQRFCPKYFQSSALSSFQFVGFKFLMSDFLTNNYFWMVDDAYYESIYDNFYFVNSQNSHCDVWTWIPEQQLKSSEYFRFMSQRVRNRMEEKFDFISFSLTTKEFITQPLNPASRFQLRNNRYFSSFPHFNFLNSNQAEIVFWNEIEKINKKIMFYSEPKEKRL